MHSAVLYPMNVVATFHTLLAVVVVIAVTQDAALTYNTGLMCCAFPLTIICTFSLRLAWQAFSSCIMTAVKFPSSVSSVAQYLGLLLAPPCLL